MANSVLRMKELIKMIAEADQAYFRDDSPIMSDREYDALVEELKTLEAGTGVIFAGSPTQRVSGGMKTGLEQVRHSKPMLSVNKTKSKSEFIRFALGRDVVLSWKLDGLTLVLRYDNGRFQQAITRGDDGLVGEDVTHTVRHFRNVPQRIDCREPVEVRGEGVLSWTDYEACSGQNKESAHPRNIAASAVRALTPDRAKCARLDFFAFELVSEGGFASKRAQLDQLENLGFSVVPHSFLSGLSGISELDSAVDAWRPDGFSYPVDGLVMEYDDLAYGRSLGSTGHHEKRMLALKWQDSLCETTFRGVELITTRTGVVSIVAEFDPVLIDGNTVKRANMFNLDIFERFQFGLGDRIQVCRANMIIPKVEDNLTRSNSFRLPEYCPCCGEKLTVKTSSGGVRNLFCPNEQCIARNARRIARFCDKSAMNIEGLSAVTMENLMARGWVKSYRDLYHLDEHREEIAEAPGFGIASYERIASAVERSRHTTMSRFLIGIGIPMMGVNAARTLEQYYCGNWSDFEAAARDGFPFARIEGISRALEQNIHRWYKDEAEARLWRPVMKELTFSSARRNTGADGSSTALTGKTVVITGVLSSMTRKKATEVLTLLGARVSESVSGNTDVLIVGMNPGGAKLGAAIRNGTKIITESDLAELLGN